MAVSPQGFCETPPGSRYPLLPGIRSRMVRTSRLRQHIYESGPATGETLVLIHGNMASGRFFEELMAALPAYHIIAPDLRGYGATEPLPTNAARGVRDYSDDIYALARTLRLGRFHLLGWSLGGVITMQYLLDHPQQVRTLTLHATGSPYGYGGTRDAEGTPNHPDHAAAAAGWSIRRWRSASARAMPPPDHRLPRATRCATWWCGRRSASRRSGRIFWSSRC